MDLRARGQSTNLKVTANSSSVQYSLFHSCSSSISRTALLPYTLELGPITPSRYKESFHARSLLSHSYSSAVALKSLPPLLDSLFTARLLSPLCSASYNNNTGSPNSRLIL